jgi:hypothetical protein
LGILSRFKTPLSFVKFSEKKYRVAALISGPEPQRTYFEMKIRAEFEKNAHLISDAFPTPFLLIRGSNLPSDSNLKQIRGVEIHDIVGAQELAIFLSASEFVLCRSGYSTLMDFARLQLPKAFLVPTPGQTEQVYLAEKLSAELIFPYQNQENFCLADFLATDYSKFKGFSNLPKSVYNGNMAQIVEKFVATL